MKLDPPQAALASRTAMPVGTPDKNVNRSMAASALALLAFTQFLVVLNTSIVNVALGTIGTQWALSATALSWSSTRTCCRSAG